MTKKCNRNIQEYYDQEKRILLGEYYIFNGRIEGECKRYYENGQLLQICNYKNNKNEGEYKEYYINGQLFVICNYKNDEREGECKSYYNNGQITEIYM